MKMIHSLSVYSSTNQSDVCYCDCTALLLRIIPQNKFKIIVDAEWSAQRLSAADTSNTSSDSSKDNLTVSQQGEVCLFQCHAFLKVLTVQHQPLND